MSYKQWTQQFFYKRQLSKVTLTSNSIAIDHPLGLQAISLDFSSCFKSYYDQYGNLTHLVIQGSRNICLGHDNPTVLQQWEEILAGIIHKTGFHDQYQPKQKVGEGISAPVFIALRKKDRKKVSVKIFCKNKLRETAQLHALQNQIQILKNTKGDFFPNFIATFCTKNSYYLIYQWCEGISLKQWVNRGLSNERQMKQIVLQICNGLKQLNSHNIVHRDIKPQNIIYDAAYRKIKIIDFGFATRFTEKYHIYPNCGTPGYAAPEVLDKSNTIIEPKVDIFSLGVTIYFLLFAKIPYQSKHNVLKANKECKFYFDQTLAEKGCLYDMIKRTICPLKYRLSLQQLMNHPYLTQNEQICLRQNIRSQILMKMRRNQIEVLDTLNQKIELKRQERIKRDRITSVRTQSQLRRYSRERSTNKTRLITEIY